MKRTVLSFIIPGLLSCSCAYAQSADAALPATFTSARIGSCLLQEDFQGGVIPGGWDIGPQVEQQDDQSGIGLGTFVDAWTVGVSPSIGDNGYFSVRGLVPDDLFAFANDDAKPCNCDLDTIALTTPSIDLTGATNTALFFRAYVNDRFGGGPGLVQISTDGGLSFIDRDTLPATGPAWQWYLVDLADLDNEPDVRVRFAWSDSSNWSVGIGIDDVCVFTRTPHDLRALEATSGELTADPADPMLRTREFSNIPLEQASPLTTSMVVMNTGTQAMTGVVVTATVSWNGIPSGSFTSTPLPTLAPASIDTIIVQTGWSATAPGDVVVVLSVSADVPDDAPADDVLEVGYVVTGPDAVDGGSAYAGDLGLVERFVMDNADGMLIGNLFEIIQPGSSLHGIGVALGEGTTVGSIIQVELRDIDLVSIAISDDHVVLASDLNPIGGDQFTFIPFDAPLALDAGTDVYALLRHVAGTSDTVVVGVSGRTAFGDAQLFRNQDLAWNPLVAAPMVRMYLNNSVGIPEPPASSLFAGEPYPVPANDVIYLPIVAEHSGSFSIQVTDLLGRKILQKDLGTLPSGKNLLGLNISAIPAGAYQLTLLTGTSSSSRSIVVQR